MSRQGCVAHPLEQKKGLTPCTTRESIFDEKPCRPKRGSGALEARSETISHFMAYMEVNHCELTLLIIISNISCGSLSSMNAHVEDSWLVRVLILGSKNVISIIKGVLHDKQ